MQAQRDARGRLLPGNTCGRLFQNGHTPANRTHGHNPRTGPSPTYSSWQAMKQRCQRPMAANYADYGGRGITVCERWHDFSNFLADMGERPAGKTLDRINNDGDYGPGNCRWATPSEQRHNQRKRAARVAQP